MVLQITCNKTKGFTLIELLIVMSLLLVVFVTPVFFSIDNFRSAIYLDEVNNLVSALEEVRALSLSSVGQNKHGLKLYSEDYPGLIIFEGNSYIDSLSDSQIRIPVTYPVEVGNVYVDEIIFNPVTGESNYEGTITVIDKNRTGASSTIYINYEGAIFY
jgi:prepilin-type N-terminal cleavage/methylation domain-containing protein